MLCLPIILALFLYDLSRGKIPLVRIDQSCWFYRHLLWRVRSYGVVVCLILWIISSYFKQGFYGFILVRTFRSAAEVTGKIFLVIKSMFLRVLLGGFCCSSCKIFKVIWVFRCTYRIPIYRRRIGVWIIWSRTSFLCVIIIFFCSSSSTRRVVIIFLGGARAVGVIFLGSARTVVVIFVIILSSWRWRCVLIVIVISIIVVLYRWRGGYVRLCSDFVTVC